MRKTITISIAILLGLTNAVGVVPGVDPKMQEALQSIVKVPTFAESAMVMPEGTSIYGPASMNQFTGGFSPENYLGAVTGDNSTLMSPQMALQKKWMDSQAAIVKSQMMLFFTEEMVTLQTDLQSTATKLTACNWTCVSDCAAPQPDLVGRANCLDSCGCFSSAKFNLTAAAASLPAVTPAPVVQKASPLAMFAADPAWAQYIPAGTPNVTVTPIAMYASTLDWAQKEMAADKIDADYKAQMKALNQAQQFAEQVLNLQLQADLAALQQAELMVAAQALAAQNAKIASDALALAAANAAAVATPVVTPIDKIAALPLMLLAVDLTPVVPALPAAPITAATLQAEHTRILTELRANFTKDKQIARIAIREMKTEMDLQFKIQQLNESMTLQNTVVAGMAPEYKALFNQLQAKEMEQLLLQQTMNKVNAAVLRVKTNTATQLTEFQTVLDSAVAQLKCDAICVSTCATAALTIDTKVLCLTTCNCYATPAIVVAPSAAVAAAVTAMTTPAVMTPSTPVVQTPVPSTPVMIAEPVVPLKVAEPVVASVVAEVQPVIQAPVAEVIATPKTAAVVETTSLPTVEAVASSTQTIVTAEPVGASAQVLFLGEEAIVAAAAGTISGSLFLATALILITLMGAAFLQSKKLLQRKSFCLGGFFNNKNERESSLDEYLLIKA